MHRMYGFESEFEKIGIYLDKPKDSIQEMPEKINLSGLKLQFQEPLCFLVSYHHTE